MLGKRDAIVFRCLEQRDIDNVISIAESVSEFVCNEEIHSWWASEDLVKWIKQEPELCFGAFSNDEIVGFCLAHLHRATCKLHIENIFVAAPWRRQKIGTYLFGRVVDAARTRCSHRIQIVALIQESNSQGRTFFEHVGLPRGKAMSWHQN
jgi:GNAT superfamily N-acetyltransferase